jgi:DNA polymerase-3 subunit epsilon
MGTFMGLIEKETFICLDCEMTGLEVKGDRIIEVAIVKFNFSEIFERYETLVDPEQPISAESTTIHNITDEMVRGMPKAKEILPQVFEMIGKEIIVGHGIGFDLDFLTEEASRAGMVKNLRQHPSIDTLRLARLYGESPTNSLERLRQHFNIPAEGAHRAMNDVLVNIEVFKYLSSKFKTTKQLMERLEKPILLKTMPLGKHKGRAFSDVPIEYLRWAVRKDFDQDLLFSIRTELKKRKKGEQFHQAGNPFSSL